MKFAAVLSRLKRIKKLGVAGLIGALRRRGRTALWRLLKKKSALNGSAHHSWETIAQQLPAAQQSFAQFWENNQLLRNVPCKQACAQADLAREAANAAVQKFSVLGSALTHFPNEINWHRDFKLDAPPAVFMAVDQKLRYEHCQFDFHLDIPMHKPPRDDANTYYEDVKTIWDFSRLHHLVALASAGESEAFEQQISSWLNANPYLLGINWKCPMDVAIRAINLIWALGLMRSARRSLPLPLAEHITCSLYDHMQYLAWNWEESDKPNNHYLADLVGYFYLCAFFSDTAHFAKKMHWALNKIEAAFRQQLLPDGTAYESSTAYHRLDTELLQHVKIVCEVINLAFPATLKDQLIRMEQFLRDCTDHGGNLVKIGDDDSGKIVFGPHIITTQETYRAEAHHPDFGLCILRNARIHVTLREAGLAPHQPSGHAHHDELALTLSIDGQPVIVDGGSFIYTGNPAWRNRMRGLGQHSTFYPDWWREQTDHAMAHGDLFQNEGPSRLFSRLGEAKKKPQGALQGMREGNITASYHLPHGQTTLTRSVKLEQTRLIISDALEFPPLSPNEAQSSLRFFRDPEGAGKKSRRAVPPPTTWQLILHPNINVTLATGNTYQLMLADGVDIATLRCNAPLQVTHDAFFAPEYGEIIPTTRFSWHGEMEKVETVITPISGII